MNGNRLDNRLENIVISCQSCNIPLEDLTFTNRVPQGTDQHKNNTIQADAVNQLKWEEKEIEPGQKIQYFISDYSRKISKRVIPMDIAKPNTKYDTRRYSKLLDACCKSIMEPFEN